MLPMNYRKYAGGGVLHNLHECRVLGAVLRPVSPGNVDLQWTAWRGGQAQCRNVYIYTTGGRKPHSNITG